MQYSVKSVFTSFFKLGLVSFGGYLALISVVHQKFVEQEKTVPNELLTDMVALSTFLPGPVAVNVVSALGFYLRGWRGAMAAFIGVLTPAFLFMSILYVLYDRFIEITIITSFFNGATSVVTAVIVSVAVAMARKEDRSSILI
ncbi:MAG: chromate transporter, partial [Cyclobacteriaceae bacterium]|nr:chromate transporter [Cyclobacteriaceae bacterium]